MLINHPVPTMKKLTTIAVPTEDLEPLLISRIDASVAAHLATRPTADQQYEVVEVAEILSLSQDTVRNYLKLAVSDPHHPRHLPYVDTTGSSRGFRVLLSDLTAWQQRNRFPKEHSLEIPVRRSAKRRS